LIVKEADEIIAKSKLASLAPQWQGHYRMIVRDFFGLHPFEKNSPEYYAAMEELGSVLQLWSHNPANKQLESQLFECMKKLGLIVPTE
jgi:hypothetical protein